MQFKLFAAALLLCGCTNQAAPNSATETTTTAAQQQSTPMMAATTEAPAAATSETPGAMKATPGAPAALEPLPGVDAPALTQVTKAHFKTTKGDLYIDIYPQAGPNAAKQFTELIKMGFYDNTPVFRIVPGFVAQFGVNSKPGMKEWKEKNFKDDPSLFRLTPGTLAFAKAGPDTNSTQVFINYGDNSQLSSNGGFTAFAKITKGYELTTKFKAVGDPSMGLDQEALWSNTDGYLKKLADKPDMIIKAEIVK